MVKVGNSVAVGSTVSMAVGDGMAVMAAVGGWPLAAVKATVAVADMASVGEMTTAGAWVVAVAAALPPPPGLMTSNATITTPTNTAPITPNSSRGDRPPAAGLD